MERLILNDMIKALKCVSSQDAEGDCYMDHENFKHMEDDKYKRIVCETGENLRDYISGKEAAGCPYHQNTYGCCFEDGELYWLKDVTELLEELKSYKNIGTPKELKELKENGAFTGLELAKLAIMQKELKKYKDLEKQGLLVRLPCKVGDTVYVPTRNFVSELRIVMISIDMHDTYFRWMLNSGIYPNLDGFSGSKLGKAVFLTCEEAEKKLEEMKNND